MLLHFFKKLLPKPLVCQLEMFLRRQITDISNIFLLILRATLKVLVAQSCPTLCDPMDCSPPGSSVHGILQARILEWVAISSSQDLPDPGKEYAPPTSPALQEDSLLLSHWGGLNISELMWKPVKWNIGFFCFLHRISLPFWKLSTHLGSLSPCCWWRVSQVGEEDNWEREREITQFY